MRVFNCIVRFCVFWIILAFLVSQTAAAGVSEQLIQIAVEVTEIKNKKAEDLGVKWISELHFEEPEIISTEKIKSLLRTTKIAADVQFLLEKHAAELLANPKLITNNGTKATFRAGGEIPYVTSNALGAGNVEFKPYGITLEIKPEIKADNYIHTDISAGVSEPDESVAVTLSGISVPGLLNREVQSTVTIKSGSTVTLAGLVQTRQNVTTTGIPIISEIPLLGRLFSFKRKVNNKTTVVIFITPTIINE